MTMLVFLFIIIAISLNYFSLEHKFYWNKTLIVLIFIIILILWEISIFQSSNNIIIYLYNGYFLVNNNLSILEWLVVLTGILSIIISYDKNKKIKERYIFILSALFGSIIFLTSTEFLTIFLGLELQSYSVYLLAASFKNYEPSETSGLNYFLLGSLSSALIFLGLGLLYVTTGILNFGLSIIILSNTDSLYGLLGLTLILIGCIWKVGAAPLHGWAIDVYDAVPSRVTAILSLLPKIALLSFIIKILNNLSILFNTSNLFSIEYFIPLFIIILSLGIGSFVGLFTQKIKRLLGYSGILNVGFILTSSLVLSTTSSAILDPFNPFFYICQYVLSTIGIWFCLTFIGEKSTEIVLNTQIQGIANTRSSTVLSVCLTLLLLSVAGIPPMIGFLAKLEILIQTLREEGYIILSLIIIITSLISTIYYLNIVRNIWFVNSLASLIVRDIQDKKDIVFLDINGSYVISLITLGITLFILQYSIIYNCYIS